jgi:Tol biopolymer transport system component
MPEVTRLSDGSGNDHDPQYAHDSSMIAFRSYRDDTGKSVLYVMNADGSNPHAISDVNGNASHHSFYIDDSIIAYQSDLDDDNDIYVYEFDSEKTRQVTGFDDPELGNDGIPEYAPTWWCNAPIVVFTSDVTEDPNIFDTPAIPIEAPAIEVEKEGVQLTFHEAPDFYPQNTPTEENASRQDNTHALEQ